MGILFAASIFWFILFSLLGSVGYFFGLSGRMRYIIEITPESVRSSSLSIASVCEAGIGSIAGNLIGGAVVGVYGTRALTLISLAAMLGALAVFRGMGKER